MDMAGPDDDGAKVEWRFGINAGQWQANPRSGWLEQMRELRWEVK